MELHAEIGYTDISHTGISHTGTSHAMDLRITQWS